MVVRWTHVLLVICWLPTCSSLLGVSTRAATSLLLRLSSSSLRRSAASGVSSLVSDLGSTSPHPFPATFDLTRVEALAGILNPYISESSGMTVLDILKKNPSLIRSSVTTISNKLELVLDSFASLPPPPSGSLARQRVPPEKVVTALISREPDILNNSPTKYSSLFSTLQDQLSYVQVLDPTVDLTAQLTTLVYRCPRLLTNAGSVSVSQTLQTLHTALSDDVTLPSSSSSSFPPPLSLLPYYRSIIRAVPSVLLLTPDELLLRVERLAASLLPPTSSPAPTVGDCRPSRMLLSDVICKAPALLNFNVDVEPIIKERLANLCELLGPDDEDGDDDERSELDVEALIGADSPNKISSISQSPLPHFSPLPPPHVHPMYHTALSMVQKCPSLLQLSSSCLSHKYLLASLLLCGFSTVPSPNDCSSSAAAAKAAVDLRLLKVVRRHFRSSAIKTPSLLLAGYGPLSRLSYVRRSLSLHPSARAPSSSVASASLRYRAAPRGVDPLGEGRLESAGKDEGGGMGGEWDRGEMDARARVAAGLGITSVLLKGRQEYIAKEGIRYREHLLELLVEVGGADKDNIGRLDTAQLEKCYGEILKKRVLKAQVHSAS